MPQRSLSSHAAVVLSGAVLLLAAQVALADEQPKLTRIQPQIEEGLAQAVHVSNAHLVHTTQLLPGADAGDDVARQSAAVLAKLDDLLQTFGSQHGDVVKLNVYVRDAAAREAFDRQLVPWSAGQPAAVAYVVTPLLDPQAAVGIDAVFAGREVGFTDGASVLEGDDGKTIAALLPRGDVVYVSGQAEPGNLPEATRATLEGLRRTLRHLELNLQHVVQLKCFLVPMSDVASVNAEIAKFFGDHPAPPVSHVEWRSGSYPIEIELVAWAPPEPSKQSVSYSGLPWLKSSPVYSRVARIHGDERIYVSGLYSPDAGEGTQEVTGAFERLKVVLEATGSDLKHLAKATYSVSGDATSSALNAVRPTLYDPQRPPAASKAMVRGVAAEKRTLTMDFIGAPVKK